jgi:hypothetical protein
VILHSRACLMRLAAAGTVILTLAATAAAAEPLAPGDPAPAFAVREFVKGEPVA